MSSHNCRACGLYIDDLPWGEGRNCPTYKICLCCGVECGNEDYTIESARRHRVKWISEGANWFNPEEKSASGIKRNSLKIFRKNLHGCNRQKSGLVLHV
jgi:hypothetical protein